MHTNTSPVPIHPFLGPLPLSTELKERVSRAVGLILGSPKPFKDAMAQLAARYPELPGETIDKRLVRALRGETEYGIGQDAIGHSRRIVFLAALSLFPDLHGEFREFGEFGEWPWANQGHLLFTDPPFVPGREAVFFLRVSGTEFLSYMSSLLEQLVECLETSLPIAEHDLSRPVPPPMTGAKSEQLDCGNAPSQPIAAYADVDGNATEGPRIRLIEGQRVVVLDGKSISLPNRQFQIIKTLLEISPSRMVLSELRKKTCEDADKILHRMCKPQGSPWAAVIHFPGKQKGLGYGIW